MIRRRADLARVAELLRGLADQINARGDRAWNVTLEWRTGPNAAPLDTGRSRTLGDPTSRAALTATPDPHAAMLDAYSRLVRAARDIDQLLRDVGPDPRPRCAWHAEGGYFAPATRTADRALVCEWCYRRHSSTGKRPTFTQLHQRAAGAQRIPRRPA